MWSESPAVIEYDSFHTAMVNMEQLIVSCAEKFGADDPAVTDGVNSLLAMNDSLNEIDRIKLPEALVQAASIAE